MIKKKTPVKKAASGTQVNPKDKAKPKTKTGSKPAYQTPADFYPESYEKKFPRTPGGGDMYPTNIKIEKERIKKGLPPRKSGGVIKKAKNGTSMKKAMMGSSMMESPMMKKGGSMKKCKYGCK